MAAANMMVTVAGAGGKTGADWDNAMGLAEFVTDLTTNVEAGDVYYIQEGTYTLTGDIATSTVGTSSAPIKLIGVVSETTADPPTSSDWAYGTDRPVFACGAYSFTLEDFYEVRGLQFTGTAATEFECDNVNVVINSSFNNSSGTASRVGAKSTASGNRFVGCEFVSTNGYAGYSINGSGTSLIDCYMHDSNFGYLLYTAYSNIIGCVFDTCSSSGLHCGTTASIWAVNGNTFYNCGVGSYFGNAGHPQYSTYLNNIFSTCTVGFQANNSGTVLTMNVFDYNCWYNNTKDMSWNAGSTEDNSAKGPHSVNADPLMTAPASGDFSLSTGSPALNTGLMYNTWTSAT